MGLPDLPTLRDLIPTVEGSVYGFEGSTFFSPNDRDDINADIVNAGLIRVGLRLYELLEWVEAHGVWLVKQFDAGVKSTFPAEWVDNLDA
jgi:hypothetical protein